MATRPEGQIVERRSNGGPCYAIRFNAYGRRRYVTLGLQADGWTRSKAEVELANVLADVRRGLWVSKAQRKRLRVCKRRVEADTVFGPFARRLVAERGAQLSESTQGYLEWGLSHLLPHFNDWFLRDIDAEAVDEFLSHKLNESSLRRAALERGKPLRGNGGRPLRPLSNSSINKLIDILQWVLSAAEEYGRIERNPARGRRRRLPQYLRPPVYLNSAAQIEALLDAADQLDRAPQTRIKERLPLIATLLFAGLRASELSAIHWGDLKFFRLDRVRASKTKRAYARLRCSQFSVGC